MKKTYKHIISELKSFNFSDLFNKEKLKRFIKYENELRHNPHKLALSIAIGLFIGFLVPIGFQTMVLIPTAFIFHVNIFLAFISTWVSNPVTVVPLYFGMFKIGELITGNQVPFDLVEKFIHNPTWEQFTNIGSQALLNYGIGAFLVAAIFSISSYYSIIKLRKAKLQ